MLPGSSSESIAKILAGEKKTLFQWSMDRYDHRKTVCIMRLVQTVLDFSDFQKSATQRKLKINI
jgi:hypothetical protein